MGLFKGKSSMKKNDCCESVPCEPCDCDIVDGCISEEIKRACCKPGCSPRKPCVTCIKCGVKPHMCNRPPRRTCALTKACCQETCCPKETSRDRIIKIKSRCIIGKSDCDDQCGDAGELDVKITINDSEPMSCKSYDSCKPKTCPPNCSLPCCRSKCCPPSCKLPCCKPKRCLSSCRSCCSSSCDLPCCKPKCCPPSCNLSCCKPKRCPSNCRLPCCKPKRCSSNCKLPCCKPKRCPSNCKLPCCKSPCEEPCKPTCSPRPPLCRKLNTCSCGSCTSTTSSVRFNCKDEIIPSDDCCEKIESCPKPTCHKKNGLEGSRNDPCCGNKTEIYLNEDAACYRNQPNFSQMMPNMTKCWSNPVPCPCGSPSCKNSMMIFP